MTEKEFEKWLYAEILKIHKERLPQFLIGFKQGPIDTIKNKCPMISNTSKQPYSKVTGANNYIDPIAYSRMYQKYLVELMIVRGSVDDYFFCIFDGLTCAVCKQFVGLEDFENSQCPCTELGTDEAILASWKALASSSEGVKEKGDEDEISNEYRVMLAEKLFSISPYDEDAPEGSLIDILTNLRHYCAVKNLNFEEAVRLSLAYFEIEKHQ